MDMFFGFGGRLARVPFILRSLLPIIAVAFVPAAPSAGDRAVAIDVLMLAILGVALFVMISLTVRRLHDLDLTGWWAAAIFGASALASIAEAATGTQSGWVTTVAEAVTTLGLALWPGTPGPNRFGIASQS